MISSLLRPVITGFDRGFWITLLWRLNFMGEESATVRALPRLTTRVLLEETYGAKNKLI